MQPHLCSSKTPVSDRWRLDTELHETHFGIGEKPFCKGRDWMVNFEHKIILSSGRFSGTSRDDLPGRIIRHGRRLIIRVVGAERMTLHPNPDSTDDASAATP